MKRILILFFCCLGISLKAFDFNHFFQAQFFPREPQFAKPDLTTLVFRAGTGTTRKSIDSCGYPLPFECEDRYSIRTFVVDLYHTFCHGIFVSGTLPFYNFNIHTTTFKRELNSLGNLCLTAGWTTNYEDCEDCDFIDVTLETGLIAPTADKPWNTTGVPIRGICAWGIYDWITVGIAADIITFFDKNNGRLWDVSWYLKADHIIRGLCFAIGYTHSNQKTTPVPWSCEIIPFWTMDSLQFTLSYDSASETCPELPTIEFFYNLVLSGKNVIKAPLWGVQIATCF